MRENARWLPAQGGYQLVLPSGQAMAGADGTTRVWNAQAVQEAAKRGQVLTDTANPYHSLGTALYGPGGMPAEHVADIEAGRARAVVAIPTPFGMVTVGH